MGTREFGDLEAAVMDRIWRRGCAVLVRDVLEDLNADRALAYATVLTVMDELHRKGWLVRRPQGRAHLRRRVRCGLRWRCGGRTGQTSRTSRRWWFGWVRLGSAGSPDTSGSLESRGLPALSGSGLGGSGGGAGLAGPAVCVYFMGPVIP